MSQKKIRKSVYLLLRTANEVWVMSGNLDDTLSLIHSAEILCKMHRLPEINDVLRFHQIIMEEFMERDLPENKTHFLDVT